MKKSQALKSIEDIIEQKDGIYAKFRKNKFYLYKIKSE